MSESRDEEEQYDSIDLSLQLALLSSVLNGVASAVEVIASLEAINENQRAQNENDQNQTELNERLKVMEEAKIESINKRIEEFLN
ncbi:hypothetical protein KQI49_04565 [Virgibacillus sp. MSJ-26]|uniref:hypothetical protein n=1 Tax=Virgibacillus sp. MSJ-26 TaxID=2841522 RepID=UPI001C10A4EB|nr:hypothetical protein [Virgibacillus sp. MSJ-26]MBU5466103.1 hypothetical protein [Virgibacillus sp. MSJ-26]